MRVLLALVLAHGGCAATGACDEDPRAQELDATVELVIDDDAVVAELATTQVERERGWRYRRCDREALVLRPDRRGPLPVWGCALSSPVDVAFVRDGVVVAWSPGLAPCDACGDACPIVGEGVEVDAVVELAAGAWRLAPGDAIDGL